MPCVTSTHSSGGERNDSLRVRVCVYLCYFDEGLLNMIFIAIWLFAIFFMTKEILCHFSSCIQKILILYSIKVYTYIICILSLILIYVNGLICICLYKLLIKLCITLWFRKIFARKWIGCGKYIFHRLPCLSLTESPLFDKRQPGVSIWTGLRVHLFSERHRIFTSRVT